MNLKPIILIDAGHGGQDPGAVAYGLREADITLAVAQLLATALQVEGLDVMLTRMSDASLSLRQRAIIEHNLQPVLYVSLHCNAAANQQARGIEIFTSPGQTEADTAATSILDAVRAAFPAANYRTDPSDGDLDKEERFFVLTMTKCPAVLLEMGFLTNPAEAAWLARRDTQLQMARAVAAGILNWRRTACPTGAAAGTA